MDTTDTRYIYVPDYNDYLECYKLCTSCTSPWDNAKCTGCVDKAYFYTDKKGLKIINDGSCWDTCPAGTYPDDITLQCLDCNDYCLCDKSNATDCLGCVYTSYRFDNVRETCFAECPAKTIYVEELQTCAACSELCDSCSGTSKTECITCVSPFILAGGVSPS